jgi:hypothetical protein
MLLRASCRALIILWSAKLKVFHAPTVTTNLTARAPAWQDLVSNNNALLATLKRKGLWQPYSCPRNHPMALPSTMSPAAQTTLLARDDHRNEAK